MNRISKLATIAGVAGLLSLGMAMPSYAWQGHHSNPTTATMVAPNDAHKGHRYGTRREGLTSYAYAPPRSSDTSNGLIAKVSCAGPGGQYGQQTNYANCY